MMGAASSPPLPEVQTRRRYRKKRSGIERFLSRISLVASSSFAYAAVYVLLFYLFRVVTALAAAYFGMEPVLQMDRIVFVRGDLWYPHAVMRTYVAGTATVGVLCILSTGLLVLFRNAVTSVRLFIIWAVVISSAMVCQRLVLLVIEEPVAFQELGAVGLELHVYSTFVGMESSERLALVMAGVGIAILTGIGITGMVRSTATSRSHMSRGSRAQSFVLHQFTIPALLGTVMVSWAAFPANILPHGICLLCTVLISIPMFISTKRSNAISLESQPPVSHWPLWPALVFFTIAFGLRIVIHDGFQL